MDILLDTHVFIWWDTRSPRLGETARRAITGRTNRVFVSAASIWEIATKRRRGKLSFPGSLTSAVAANRFFEIAASGADCEAAGDLAWVHADPFDRLIIAQARARSLTLTTDDSVMQGFAGVGTASVSPFLFVRAARPARADIERGLRCIHAGDNIRKGQKRGRDPRLHCRGHAQF